jgi:choline transport protein
VEPHTSIPLYSIAIVTIVPALLAVIYIGSSTVFEDVVSLSTSGLYSSYFIPCALLLWRRTTGRMAPHRPQNTFDCDLEGPDLDPNLGNLDYEMDLDPSSGLKEVLIQPPLSWGPWRLPPLLGTLNNIYACVYILFVLFWSFWPPSTPTSASTMNYAVVVTGGVVIFSIVYYFLYGKRTYMGPLVEREVRGYVADRGRKGTIN